MFGRIDARDDLIATHLVAGGDLQGEDAVVRRRHRMFHLHRLDRDDLLARRDLRAVGDVHWHEGLGLSVAVSHSAASAVLRHRRLGRIWTDATPLEQFASFNLLHRNSLLENEPPAHTRLRRLVSSAFSRGHVERLRPAVEAIANGMVDALADAIRTDGEADLLAHLAQPLPVAVIAELLGVPQLLVVGRGAAEGNVELWDRRTGEREVVPAAEAVARLTA